MSLENITQMAKGADKPQKPEKSQAELRASLESKLNSLKPIMEDGIKEFEQSLKDDVFEDQEGEEEGSGEKRKEAMQNKLTDLLERAKKMKARLDSKELLPQVQEEISVAYTYTNPKTNAIERQETITLNLDTKLQEFLSLYQKTKLDLPPDFETAISDIWERNQEEIEKAIKENGFDDILIVPATPDIGDLSEKMKMEDGYHDWIKANANVRTLSGIPLTSQNIDKPRVLLVHKAQNLKDRPELAATLNIKGLDVKLDQSLTLEDYLVFQRKYFEETGKHLDEVGWTWLSSKSGARLVNSYWLPESHKLFVYANDLGNQDANLGVRPSRCF